MHHPRSISTVRHLRIVSLLLLGNRLLIPVAAGILLVSLLTDDQRLMTRGLFVVVMGVVLLIVQWVAASHAGCPLCRVPVLAPISCTEHRKARRLFGSYKLRVALAIIFTDRFRCPYCNESIAMDVRESLRSSRPRGTRMTE